MSSTATSTAPVSRSVAALMRDRMFGSFVLGKLLSACGNWVQQVAAAVLMFQLTGSAFMVGIVSAVLFAGPLVLALWTGTLADRRDRRHLIMVGRTVTALAVGVLAILLALHGVDGFGGAGVLLAASAVMGVGHALSVPSMQAIVPGLVPEEDLEQALAFASAAPSIARTAGPALGAGLIVLGGPGLAFAAAAVTHGFFVVVLLWVRARPARKEQVRSSVLGGVRYLVADRTSRLIMLAIALMGFGADTVITLTPSLAHQLGGGSELVGVFASAFGAGGVLAVGLFRSLRRLLSLRRAGIAGYVTIAAGLAMAALVPSPNGVAAGFLVAGLGFMVGTVALNTRVQRRVPDELRGRVMALWGVAFLGSRPLAALVNGAIADIASVTVAMLVAAAITLAAVLLARVRADSPAGHSDGSRRIGT